MSKASETINVYVGCNEFAGVGTTVRFEPDSTGVRFSAPGITFKQEKEEKIFEPLMEEEDDEKNEPAPPPAQPSTGAQI